MVDEFIKNGYWTQETFYDFWDRNAREYGDREALVDSKYRLTWAEAKRLVDAMAISWVEMGIPQAFPHYHPVAQQRLRIFSQDRLRKSWPNLLDGLSIPSAEGTGIHG